MAWLAIKRAAQIVFGVFLALALTEAGMRIASWRLRREVQAMTVSGSPGSSCRILCLGESTTAPVNDAHGRDISWPAQMESLLKKHYPARSFEVINKGYASTNTSAILANLPDYLRKYRPRIVLSMIGVNDGQWYGIVTFTPGALSFAEKALGSLRVWELLRYFYYQYAPAQKTSEPPPSHLDEDCDSLAFHSSDDPARARKRFAFAPPVTRRTIPDLTKPSPSSCENRVKSSQWLATR